MGSIHGALGKSDEDIAGHTEVVGIHLQIIGVKFLHSIAVTDYHVSLIPKECAVEHVIGWISKYLLAFSQAMVIFPKKKICVFAFTKKKICVFAFIYTFASYIGKMTYF